MAKFEFIHKIEHLFCSWTNLKQRFGWASKMVNTKTKCNQGFFSLQTVTERKKHTLLSWHTETKIRCCRRKCSCQEETLMPGNLLSYNTTIIKQTWQDMDFITQTTQTLPNFLLNKLIKKGGQFRLDMEHLCMPCIYPMYYF